MNSSRGMGSLGVTLGCAAMACCAVACSANDGSTSVPQSQVFPAAPGPSASGNGGAPTTPATPPPAGEVANGGSVSEAPPTPTLDPTTAAGGSAAASPAGAGGAPETAQAALPCVGVPITPDATGLVAAGTNPLGIHGSWFVYSDCVDLGGVNCATVTSPVAPGFANVGGKMCTSGQTSMANGAWGAGLGLELNDGPPQMPYDTTAQGIKGFCFQLSGSAIPSTTIRVAFPTQGNQDNAYFESVSTPGQNTVLFADTAQGSWVTQTSDFAPTAVTLIQFQIPSDTTAPVPWDFCIEGLTAVTE